MNSTCNAVRLGTIGAIMAGFALIASPAQADRVEKHFPVQSKPMVTVRNASGKIQVKAWSKNEVQVAWTNAGGKAVVETEQAGNRIEVATHMANEQASAEDVKTDFEVTVRTMSGLGRMGLLLRASARAVGVLCDASACKNSPSQR